MSVLIFACPARVILHLTVEAVTALIAIVNPGIQPLDPLHVLDIVLCAVPIGALADWAGICLVLRKEEVFITPKTHINKFWPPTQSRDDPAICLCLCVFSLPEFLEAANQRNIKD